MMKMVKRLICAYLIITFVMPSFATTGVSDGTAFITKKEFDAALSDFNGRLSSFQAGINSKIDSQVSSYLDRNGIWSAKSMVLDNAKTSIAFYHNIVDPSTAVSSGNVWEPPRPDADTSSDGGYWTKAVKADHAYYVYKEPAAVKTEVIKSIKKTGLCVMPVTIRTSYWSSSDNDSTVQTKFYAGTTQIDAGGTPYWISTYFKNGGEKYAGKIEDIAQSTGCCWQGTYYFCKNDDGPWINFCFEQQLNIYNGTNLRYNIVVNKQLGTNSTNTFENHTDRMFTIPFSDPIIKDVCMFFVDKNQNLSFESKIFHTGWSTASFVSHKRSSIMSMVVQPESIDIY